MNLSRTIRLCAFALAIAVPAVMVAQFEAATVLGTIRDASGSVVPNCKVTLENVKTGVTVSTNTDGNGNYEFVSQHLGQYKIRVEASGFQTAEASAFELTTNARQRVDLTLQVGPTTTQVTITDAASMLETETSSRGQVISQAQIVELPLNGRAYADLTLLSPGVAKSALQNQADSSRDASFNVNGGRSEQNNFMLDGVDNNAYGTSNQGFSNQVIQANPDSLAEFKIETNNYSAEFGRASGAVISATIKSGTNQYHGEAWEFFRNTVLNAQGFFKPVGGGSLPYNQNQFGGAFGGPIVKDKLFFFADYEGFRRVSHPVQFATLPTTAMTQGDFQLFRRAHYQSHHRPVLCEWDQFPSRPSRLWRPPFLATCPRPTFLAIPIITNRRQPIPSTTTKATSAWITFSTRNCRFSFATARRKRTFSIRTASPIRSRTSNNNGNVHVLSKEGVGGATWTMSPTSVLEARVGITHMIRWKNASPTLGLEYAAIRDSRPADGSIARRRPVLRRTQWRTYGVGALLQQSSVSVDPFVANPEDRLYENHQAP